MPLNSAGDAAPSANLNWCLITAQLVFCLTLIMVFCRPPNCSKFVNHFKHTLHIIDINKYQSVLILRDFNFPNIWWIDGCGFSNRSTSDENKFVEILTDLYLILLINSPTRANNILDQALTNNPDGITSIQTGAAISDIGLPSDHFPIIFDIRISYVYIKRNKKKKTQRRKVKNLSNPFASGEIS